MKKTNDLFPTWIGVPAQIFPTVNKWKKKSHRHRNASGDERVARKRKKKKNVFSLSLSRTGSLCYASSCVARAHSYASGVKILFFIFLAYFLGNTRHKREMKQTRKKPRVARVREWQTGKLLLFRPPIEEGERKTPEKTKHTCRDSISFFFFFAFGNPGYTFRVF